MGVLGEDTRKWCAGQRCELMCSACRRAVARACCCVVLRAALGGSSAGLAGRGVLVRSSRCSLAAITLRLRQPGWGVAAVPGKIARPALMS